MQNGTTIACKVTDHDLCTDDKCKCTCHVELDLSLPKPLYLIWETGVELCHLRGHVERERLVAFAAKAVAQHSELSAFPDLAEAMVAAVEALDWGPDSTSWYWSYHEYMEHLSSLLPQATADKLILAPYSTGLERL